MFVVQQECFVTPTAFVCIYYRISREKFSTYCNEKVSIASTANIDHTIRYES